MWPFTKKKPVQHVASVPTGAPIHFFTPLVNFESAETASAYVAGMKYTVREGNTHLDNLVREWVERGMVEYT